MKTPQRGALGWGWGPHYVGWEDGAAACDSDRELRWSWMYMHGTAGSWKSYALVFLSWPLQLLIRRNLVWLIIGSPASPMWHVGKQIWDHHDHNKRQRLTARNIYIKLDEVQPRWVYIWCIGSGRWQLVGTSARYVPYGYNGPLYFGSVLGVGFRHGCGAVSR